MRGGLRLIPRKRQKKKRRRQAGDANSEMAKYLKENNEREKYVVNENSANQANGGRYLKAERA